MYKNRAASGKNNVCGDRVRAYREALPSKLRVLAKVLDVSYSDLLDEQQ